MMISGGRRSAVHTRTRVVRLPAGRTVVVVVVVVVVVKCDSGIRGRGDDVRRVQGVRVSLNVPVPSFQFQIPNSRSRPPVQ